jgi:hypothetical protein
VFQWDQQGAGTLVNPQIHDNFIDPNGVMYAVISPALQNSTGIINPVTYNNINMTVGKVLLSGPYNNRFSGVPSRSPAAPVIASASRVDDGEVVLAGTSVPSVRIDIYDRDTMLGVVRSDRLGNWRISLRLSENGRRTLRARATDGFANSGPLSEEASISPQ